MRGIRFVAGTLAAGLCAAALAGTQPLFTKGEFLTGCNYWASDSGIYMWRRWNPTTVEKDFAELAQNGVCVMRVFPLWPDFQPLTRLIGVNGKDRGVCQADGTLKNVAGVDDEMMRRFRHLCDVAAQHKVRLVVGLVTGWMSGRTFVPPAFEGRNLLTDPEVVMWQVRFVRRFVRKMKDHPAIVGWDLGNECNCLASVSGHESWLWMNAIAGAIRAEDATRPVISGMHGGRNVPSDAFSLQTQGELTDELCTHPYPLFTANCALEPFDTMRCETHPVAESLYYAGISGRHCFIEEAGDLGRGTCSPEKSAANVRCALPTAWANGLGAYVWWCAYDQDRLDYPPYTWNAVERELGLFTADHEPKPVLKELGAFRRFLASLPGDVAALPPRRVDAVVLVSELEHAWPSVHGAFMLARQAGFDVAYASAEKPLPESSFYILPSGKGIDVYCRQGWLAALEKARAGATLFISKGNQTRYSGFLEATGNRIDSFVQRPRDFAFELEGRRIRAADSTTTVITPVRSRVLATGSDGSVALTVCAYGKGKVIFCNFPIERDSAERTGIFSGKELNPRYLVYKAAAELAGIRRTLTKDQPNVGLTEHRLANGHTIIVAVNDNDFPVTCGIRYEGRIGKVYRGKVGERAIEFPANDFAVFELQDAAPTSTASQSLQLPDCDLRDASSPPKNGCSRRTGPARRNPALSRLPWSVFACRGEIRLDSRRSF